MYTDVQAQIVYLQFYIRSMAYIWVKCKYMGIKHMYCSGYRCKRPGTVIDLAPDDQHVQI